MALDSRAFKHIRGFANENLGHSMDRVWDRSIGWGSGGFCVEYDVDFDVRRFAGPRSESLYADVALSHFSGGTDRAGNHCRSRFALGRICADDGNRFGKTVVLGGCVLRDHQRPAWNCARRIYVVLLLEVSAQFIGCAITAITAKVQRICLISRRSELEH